LKEQKSKPAKACPSKKEGGPGWEAPPVKAAAEIGNGIQGEQPFEEEKKWGQRSASNRSGIRGFEELPDEEIGKRPPAKKEK